MIKSYKTRTRIVNVLLHILLAVLSIIWLIPIAWLLMFSFNADKGMYHPDYIIPKNWTFDNYINLFTKTDLFKFPTWFMNTFIIAIVCCVLSTFFVLATSYTFSRLRFKSRKKIMNISLILGMFPGFMSMIAIYHLMKELLGLEQSKIALVLVYSGGAALGYFISKGFFDTIPRALDEAATLDGATKNQIFWKITLPMSKPILVYTALTAFIAPWLDFIFVSVIMKDNYKNYTVALGLFQMVTRENVYQYFTQFCAGAVIIAIPISVLFIIMQKFYVGGVVGGSVKG